MLQKLSRFMSSGTPRQATPEATPPGTPPSTPRQGSRTTPSPADGPGRRTPPGEPSTPRPRDTKERDPRPATPEAPSPRLSERAASLPAVSAVAPPSAQSLRVGQLLDALERSDRVEAGKHLDELWAVNAKAKGVDGAPERLRVQLREALANRGPLAVARCHLAAAPRAPRDPGAAPPPDYPAKRVLQECLAEFNAGASLFVRPAATAYRAPSFAELQARVPQDLAATGRLMRWIDTRGMGHPADTVPRRPDEVDRLLSGEQVSVAALRQLVGSHGLDLRGCSTQELEAIHARLAALEVNDTEAAFVHALCWRGIEAQREALAIQQRVASDRVRDAIASLDKVDNKDHGPVLAHLDSARAAIDEAYRIECQLAAAAGRTPPAHEAFAADQYRVVVAEAWDAWTRERPNSHHKLKGPLIVALLEGVDETARHSHLQAPGKAGQLAGVRSLLLGVVAVSRDAPSITTPTVSPSKAGTGTLAVSKALDSGLSASIANVSAKQLGALSTRMDGVFASMDRGLAELPVSHFGLTGQACQDMPRGAHYTVRVGEGERWGLRITPNQRHIEIFRLDASKQVVATVGRELTLAQHLGIDEGLLRRAMHFSTQESLGPVEEFFAHDPLSPLVQAFNSSGVTMAGGEQIRYDLAFRPDGARLRCEYARDQVTNIVHPKWRQPTDPARTFLRTCFELDLPTGKPPHLVADSLRLDFRFEAAGEREQERE